MALRCLHRLARVAEHDGRGRFDEAQQIDDRRLALLRIDADGAIFDVDMAVLAALDLDPHGVALIVSRQRRDRLGHGRGKQQAAFVGRHGGEHEFEILAEAEIEHLVGFVEHHDCERRNIERLALDVIAQAARRAHYDMDARLQGAPLALRVHAADARHDPRAGGSEKPRQLALNLQRQFARRRDDQRERRAGRGQRRRDAEQRLRHRDAIGDGLARAGLGRNQEIPTESLRRRDRGLNRRRLQIAALRREQAQETDSR